MLQKPMISMSGLARPLRFGVQTPSKPNDRCDRWVLGGTEKRTPWNPSVPHISGPMLQKPMISMSGPARPLRFGVQTPSKPHDRCDHGVLGGTEKRTPWNPSVPQSGLAVWPLFLKALSANRSPSKLQGTFNNVFHSLFMELCSKIIVVKMREQNKTLKRSVPCYEFPCADSNRKQIMHRQHQITKWYIPYYGWLLPKPKLGQPQSG